MNEPILGLPPLGTILVRDLGQSEALFSLDKVELNQSLNQYLCYLRVINISRTQADAGVVTLYNPWNTFRMQISSISRDQFECIWDVVVTDPKLKKYKEVA